MSTDLPTKQKARDLVIQGIDEEPDPNIFKHNDEGLEEESKQQKQDMNSTFTVWKRDDTETESPDGANSPGRHAEDVKNRQSIIMKGPRGNH